MYNFIWISVIILIFQDIIILNEESLILLCFIIFNWLVYKNYGFNIKQSLLKRSDSIENQLKKSLLEYTQVLELNLKDNNNVNQLNQNILDLETHILNFNIYICKILPKYKFFIMKLLIIKKLKYIKDLENQTLKLILILLLKKVEKIVYIDNFFIYKLKITKFSSLYKINIREYLKLIK